MLSWDDKAEVVRGTASLIANARLGSSDMAEAAQQLALPFARLAELRALEPGDRHFLVDLSGSSNKVYFRAAAEVVTLIT